MGPSEEKLFQTQYSAVNQMSRLFILAQFQVSPRRSLHNLFQRCSTWQPAEPAVQWWKRTQRQPLHALMQWQRLHSEGAAVPVQQAGTDQHMQPPPCSAVCILLTRVGKCLLCICFISVSILLHSRDFISQHTQTKQWLRRRPLPPVSASCITVGGLRKQSWDAWHSVTSY